MYTHNASVSVRQAKILLILQMFNMTMVLLPRTAANYAGNDGYLLPLLSFAFGALYVEVITRLLNRFPGEGLDTIAPKVLTKAIGFIVVTFFVIKLLISAGLEVRMFGEMVGQVLLPTTPLPVVIIMLLLAVYYLIKSGLEASGRMAEVLCYFVFVPLAIILCLAMIRTDYKELLPFLNADPKNFVTGAYLISMTFMPLELLLIIGCLISKPSQLKRIGLYTIGVISIIEIILIGLTFCGIGVVESRKQIWPVITLMQSIQLPGSFIENQEVLMMSWWVLSVYTYVSGAIYVAALTISKVFHFHRQNVTALPLIPIVFFISLFPDGLGTAYTYITKFNAYMGPVFLFIVPLILLVIAKVRKVGGKHV